jgi:glucose/arabinose dehydrogenase
MKRSALIVALLVIAGCADDGVPEPAAERESSAIVVTTTTATTATTATAAPDSPATDGATSTTPPTAVGADSPRVGDPRVGSELVTEVDRPVDLVLRPGDDAFHLVNQTGTLVRFDPATGSTRTTLDITALTAAEGERGLLGLEFSADGSHGYVDYTNRDGDTVIAEYAVREDGTFDVDSARVLMTIDQPYGNHNGGDLALGPDGRLYIALGDGGSAGDPERRASDPTSLLGKLLRIDPTPSPDAPYSIPPDNPFASGPLDGVSGAPEVWSWGLRNPWKIAFDPVTDDLWIADVGQNLYEEVDHVTPGDHPAGYAVDFGWSAFEGTVPYNTDVDPNGTTFPVLTYEHGDDGCSISGGAVYRGTAIAELEPAYLYSDYCSGILWALDLAGARNLVVLDGFDQVTAVRTGPDGEVYVLEAGGGVHRVVPG